MRRVCFMSLLLVVSSLPAAAATPRVKTIDFPCLKNLADSRFLVDGQKWDARMRALGYDLADGAYVPYEVTSFTRRKLQDEIWAEGTCRMKLLPVAK